MRSTCVVQALTHVYAAQDMPINPHVLISLVLYKAIDPSQVREDSPEDKILKLFGPERCRYR